MARNRVCLAKRLGDKTRRDLRARVLEDVASLAHTTLRWTNRTNTASAGWRAGFTLLELILALSLSSLILMAVGMAVHLHLHSFDSRQNVLNESQLARVVLEMIAHDIRSVAIHYEQDVSGVQEMLSQVDVASLTGTAEPGSGETGSGDAGNGSSGGQQDGSQTSQQNQQNGAGGQGEGSFSGAGFSAGSSAEANGSSGSATGGDTANNTEDIANATMLPETPGIYGNQYEIQIDISRLPRVDQYQPLQLENPNAQIIDIPSDTKTVSYFMQAAADAATTANLDPFAAAEGRTAQGLVRRQVDRAVTRWAMTNSAATQLMQSGDLLAPEVIGVEFQYFDGLEWQLSWDTEFYEGLPLAIQVRLYMRSDDEPESTDEAEEISEGTTYYQMIVHLPIGTTSGAPEATDTGTSDGSGVEGSGI